MCGDCYPATRTISAIAYAVPVDIVSLGASLAALDALQPTIRQLQLCHRFGDGDRVHITKLPQEMLDLVILALFTGEQRQHITEWAQAKACYDGECASYDHFTEAELDEIRDQVMSEAFLDCDTEEAESIVGEMLTQELDEMDWYETCVNRKTKWLEMTMLGNPEKPCRSSPVPGMIQYNEVLRKTFGLEAFTMRQTIPSNMQQTLGRYSWREEPQQESIAVLTLPCKRHAQDILTKDAEHSDYDFEIDGSAGLLSVIDPLSLVMNEERQQRFRRAMKFFDLRPKICRTQVLNDHDNDGPILTKEENIDGPRKDDTIALRARIDARVKQLEDSEWPKLLNLTSVSINFGPY